MYESSFKYGCRRITILQFLLMVIGVPSVNSKGCIPHMVEKIAVDKCSSDVTISWRPHTTGIPYTISIQSVNNASATSFEETFIPKKTDLRLLHPHKKLTEKTKYKLEITGCPSKDFVTGISVPPPSGKLYSQFQKSGHEKTCNVQTTFLVKDFDRLTITIVSTPLLKSLQSDAPVIQNELQVFNETADDRSFPFKTKPNKKYKGFVRAWNCGGPGQSFEVGGMCYTRSATPKSVSTPVLIYGSGANDFNKIKVYPVNENNGPVSCYFVLLQGSTNPESITFGNSVNFDSFFSEYSGIISDTFPIDQIFIAAAIPSQKIKFPYLELNLGDGTTSECDTMNVWNLESPESKKTKASMFKGVNLALPRSITVKLAVIVSTPISLPNQVEYKSSSFVQFLTASTEIQMFDDNLMQIGNSTVSVGINEPPSTITTALVVGLLVGVVVTFIIFVIVTKFRKQRQKRKRDSKAGLTNDSISATPRSPTHINVPPMQMEIFSEDNKATKGDLQTFRPSEKHLYESMKSAPSHSYENLTTATSSHYEVPLTPLERLRMNSAVESQHSYDTVYESHQEVECQYFSIDS